VDDTAETAQWNYTGGDGFLTGSATGPGTGWAFTAPGIAGVDSISFFATDPLSSANSDFALAALDVEPIPEPATLALMGAGLLGLGVRRSRRR
jgi:hypothetical protein